MPFTRCTTICRHAHALSEEGGWPLLAGAVESVQREPRDLRAGCAGGDRDGVARRAGRPASRRCRRHARPAGVRCRWHCFFVFVFYSFVFLFVFDFSSAPLAPPPCPTSWSPQQVALLFPSSFPFSFLLAAPPCPTYCSLQQVSALPCALLTAPSVYWVIAHLSDQHRTPCFSPVQSVRRIKMYVSLLALIHSQL